MAARFHLHQRVRAIVVGCDTHRAHAVQTDRHYAIVRGGKVRRDDGTGYGVSRTTHAYRNAEALRLGDEPLHFRDVSGAEEPIVGAR